MTAGAQMITLFIPEFNVHSSQDLSYAYFGLPRFRIRLPCPLLPWFINRIGSVGIRLESP
jgi:hypothetical protein